MYSFAPTLNPRSMSMLSIFTPENFLVGNIFERRFYIHARAPAYNRARVLCDLRTN